MNVTRVMGVGRVTVGEAQPNEVNCYGMAVQTLIRLVFVLGTRGKLRPG